MMYRLWIFVGLMGVLGPVAAAQPMPPASPDRGDASAVRATLDALFEGMRAGDSAAVRAVFHDEARLHTAGGSGDAAGLQETSVEAFAGAVGQSREEVWDERIWDVTIRVDGALASAWVPYVFYRGDDLSHCGVNAVQFVRQGESWRILQLTDTRREDCSVPDEIQK